MTGRVFRAAFLACLVAGFAATPLFSAVPSGLLEIHQINVGQGQSTLVIGPDGTTVLLDSGRNGQGATIVSYLQSIGILPSDGLDYTIAGHMDSDHIGGFDEVIQSGYDVLIDNWSNGSTKSTQSIIDYQTAVAGTTAGGPFTAVLGGTIPLGDGAVLTVVAVGGDVIGFGHVAGSENNENDLSIALLIQYGGFDFIWASDLGGGADDGACTGRSTGQVNVETPLAQSITPGGAFPLLSAQGVDVMTINHHGSESSTNSDYMNLLKPEVALIPVGDGQGVNFQHPRIDVVEHVLMAQAPCVTAPPALVLQSEEGNPTGAQTSFAGFAVGDIIITTDGISNYQIEATGAVTVGPDERAAAGLPRTMALDEGAGGNTAPAVTIAAPGNGSSFESGTLVSFSGTATDAEDGDLTASLAWSSNLDGPIGTGGSFAIDTLSVGNHTITAQVTDSGGLSGVSSIGLTIFVPAGSSGLILSEVLYDVSGSDDGLEWVELYNSGSAPVDLSSFSLGNGGSDYTYSKVQLSGIIDPGQVFVVGGPTSNSSNGFPFFDQVVNFSPDFQNSGADADGVALFNVPASQVNSTTVPIDAVVYGPVNSNNLIDESGAANAPEVGAAAANSSIERIDLAGTWQIQGNPTPNATSLPPPSGGNTAPVTTISAPLDGAVFEQGAVVTFIGSAADAEDGDLTASLEWASDIDGPIGSGGSFTATLSVGTHAITAAVTDSGGLEGSDVITVTVNPTGQPVTVSFDSIGSEDGWVRESAEGSGQGGRINSGSTGTRAIRAGDDNRNRQYKSILSFDTSSIPDGATIVSATVTLRRGQLTGGNPFDTHGSAQVDVQSGGFSGSTALQVSDFEAAATVSGAAVLTVPAFDGDFSDGVLNSAGQAAINLSGTTQVRIAFDLASDGNNSNDYMGFFSGDDSDPANRPQLVVTYIQ